MWVKGMSLKFFQEKKLPTQDKKTEQKVAVWYSDNNTLKYTAQILFTMLKGTVPKVLNITAWVHYSKSVIFTITINIYSNIYSGFVIKYKSKIELLQITLVYINSLHFWTNMKAHT